MNGATVSTLRAQLNRLRWWWLQRMGWAGAAAAVLAVAAVVLALTVRPGIADLQRRELQAHVAQLDATVRVAAATPAGNERDPRDSVRDALPSVSRRAESIVQLLSLLDQAKVVVDRAEYTAEDTEPGLVRLRVSLPVQGSYGPARELIGNVLNTMPNAALDGLELERQPDGRDGIGGRLHFSLFFRREAP
jgi:hypothetical protein